jgi:Big-like domain-containing protein
MNRIRSTSTPVVGVLRRMILSGQPTWITARSGVPLASAALLLLGACGKNGSAPTVPGGGGGNHNPTTNLNIDQTHLGYGRTAQLTVIASDPDGDQLTFSWSATLGTVTSSGPTATAATFTAGTQWGQASVTVTAADGRGGAAQATALTYIRNPTPPAITIRAAGSAHCGYGTSRPECFQLRMATPEAMILTTFWISPSTTSGCSYIWSYENVPIAANGTYLFEQPGNDNVCAACNPCGGNPVDRWDLRIRGRRPEPDGGSFAWERTYWQP